MVLYTYLIHVSTFKTFSTATLNITLPIFRIISPYSLLLFNKYHSFSKLIKIPILCLIDPNLKMSLSIKIPISIQLISILSIKIINLLSIKNLFPPYLPKNLPKKSKNPQMNLKLPKIKNPELTVKLLKWKDQSPNNLSIFKTNSRLSTINYKKYFQLIISMSMTKGLNPQLKN